MTTHFLSFFYFFFEKKNSNLQTDLISEMFHVGKHFGLYMNHNFFRMGKQCYLRRLFKKYQKWAKTIGTTLWFHYFLTIFWHFSAYRIVKSLVFSSNAHPWWGNENFMFFLTKLSESIFLKKKRVLSRYNKIYYDKKLMFFYQKMPIIDHL